MLQDQTERAKSYLFTGGYINVRTFEHRILNTEMSL